MAFTAVNKSSAHFNTKTYTGNGSARSITGVGFQPDFTWIKGRNTTANHALFDVVRGATKVIGSNTTTAEATEAQMLTAFVSDGISLGTDSTVNDNTSNFVSWNWKANGAGSSNSDGNGITSTVSANTTSGFSIVKYTGNGSASATIGHGLGVKPAMVILRPLSYSGAWWIVHKDLTADYVLEFNQNAEANISSFGGGGLKYSTFTTSVIGGGNGSSDSGLWNGSGQNYIAYCFAEKTGFCKIGKYLGNETNDNAFIYTGFKPKFVLIYNYHSSNDDWFLFDSERLGYNSKNNWLEPNTTSADNDGENWFDMYSNGFKITTSASQSLGHNGHRYMYIAFGQSLVGSNNVPATAR